MTAVSITVECNLCHAQVPVPHAENQRRQLDFVFRAGFHIVHLEPALDHDDHSDPIVCTGCARRINGQMPS